MSAAAGESDLPAVHVIVLAAGASTRFGSPKQLVRLRGRPLLHLAVSRATEVAGHAVTVVLGSQASELAPLLKHTPASVIVNRAWAEGIASSIRAGVTRLPPSCEGVLLMLADQPAVTSEDLRRLIGAWRRQPQGIAAAQYASTLGVPAIFPRADFPALLQLRGDQGARALLRANSPRVARVPLASAAVDIDTPEDLLQIDSPE
ncbi:MAG TPA: nucleotidyltransferase family protein [Steroidobacteraceae bacterium]|nr:nucleotidyltransferase family protein [Steroidobacteraceae bacterium]